MDEVKFEKALKFLWNNLTKKEIELNDLKADLAIEKVLENYVRILIK